MAEKCPGCGKKVRRLEAHLRLSHTCAEALEYQRTGVEAAKPVSPTVEDDDGDDDFTRPGQSLDRPEVELWEGEVKHVPASHEAPPPPPPTGLTEAEVKTLLAEGIAAAITQMGEAINQRLEAERQNTQQQFTQVGPAVLKYLREEGAKEQQNAQQPAASTPQQPDAPGNGLAELGKMLALFQKPAGSGVEQIAETIGSIGKLADALDSLRYRPWRDGVDFATQNILQQTRMGIEPGKAAEGLQANPPNWAKRPEVTGSKP